MGKKFILILFFFILGNNFQGVSASDLSIDDFELLGSGEEESFKTVSLIINEEGTPKKKKKRKTIFGHAAKTLRYVGSSLLGSSLIRNTLAWGVTYYGMGAVEEGLSVGASGVGTLFGGPGAGSASYYTVKGTFKAARWLGVGFDKWVPGILSPVTRKIFIDPVFGVGTLLLTDFEMDPEELMEKEKTS